VKRIAILVPAIVIVVLLTPLAQAACTTYHCRVGNCPWVELLLDEGFTTPSCPAWTFTRDASRSSGPMCSWTNEPYAQIMYLGGFLHTGTVYQTVTTIGDSTGYDDFDFNYTIETDSLAPGDTIKVTITDLTTGIVKTTDTFGAEMWCNSVSHEYLSAGWKGHQVRVKFAATLSDPATVVKITGVDLWQHVTY